MKNIFKNPFYYLGIIFIGIIFGLLFKSASAWIEPSEVTNILSPINSGVTSQTKSGGLLLNSLGATVGLTVEKGRTGIGTTSPQSILDITSTTKALLPPRLTTAQRDTMLSPQFGMVIINTDTKKINLYNGSTWEAVTGGNTLTDSKTIFSSSEARNGDYYCKKTTILDDGKQGDWTTINESKICGSGKWCKAGNCSLCGVDLYWNGSSPTCSSVGTGNYSPESDNTLYNCSNKPVNSSYTSAGNGTNSCSWSCNAGFVQNGSSCNALPAKIITTVDSGSNASVTLGLDGFALISYTDSARNLKFARCTNADCTTKNITTVDSDIYYNSSIAIGSDGFARISYMNHSGYNLRFARCTNADCTTKNITILDPTNGTGDYSKISMGLDGLPRVNYEFYPHDYMDSHVRFARCTNADCTTKNITDIGVGSSTSMDLGSDGLARVSYFSGSWSAGYPNLIFASCTNADCTTKTTSQVDSISYPPMRFAVAVGSDNLSRIAYHHSSSSVGFLRFARCTNADCSTKNITTVDPDSKGSNFTSMILGSDGFARIGYTFKATDSDLKFVRCTNADCTTKNTTIIDSTGNVGFAPSMILGSDGFIRAGYSDATNKTIKFVRCTNDNCSD